MKKIKILIMNLIIMIPIFTLASGGIDVSTTTITMQKGETKIITIKATNAAGVVNVSSSNDGIVNVEANKKQLFFDTTLPGLSSYDIILTANELGTATISVKLSDVATFDNEELTGTKIISVTVNSNNSENEEDASNTSPDNQNGQEIHNVPKTESDTSLIVIIVFIIFMVTGLYFIVKVKKINKK